MEQKQILKRAAYTMEVDREEFAIQLKTYRLRQAMTQEQLANAWGCSRYTIMRCERGKNITWETAYKIFARLAVELRKEDTNITNEIV